MYSIAIYCPDSHLVYDRFILDRKGVGGGATARVRIAYALAARGHRVQLFINCPNEKTELGVKIRHFSSLKQNTSDIFIASTSGGNFNLASLGSIRLENGLKILLVHGVLSPNSLSSYPFEFVYSPSNFIRGKAVHEWGVAQEKVFVSHRGVMERYFTSRWLARRDPFALVYAGHPSKGLETAIAILRSLRESETRFHLHVYSGAGLWGETGEIPKPEAGITFHGIVGQRQLARELQRCSYSLNLQDREEPFGMAVIEAMRAGCIVLASPVGALSETITHGRDGVLVSGDHMQEPTRRAAADLILALARNREYAGFLRQNAIHSPLTWDQVARSWEGHWEWFFSGQPSPNFPALGACGECQGDWLPLADGLHCTNCGRFQRLSDVR
jgi:glycosyltransferase involved in cell wall biosynthesis